MHLTPDYLISDCGCPQTTTFGIGYPVKFNKNCFQNNNIRFHNYITSSRIRLMPKRESLSDYYDKLLMNSSAPRMSVPPDVIKKQLPMQSDTIKHMKCGINEAIRQVDKRHQSANILDKKHTR